MFHDALVSFAERRIIKMKFKEYDTVRIMKDYEEDVKKGELGVIIMAFEKPREAYEVEIVDDEGNPKAQCTLLPDDLELIKNFNNNNVTS